MNSASSQVLMALAIAALSSWLRDEPAPNSGSSMPMLTALGSRCCWRMKSRSEPGSPPPGGHASRREVAGEYSG